MPEGDPTPAPTPEPTPAPEPERTFTQTELDRIVQDRVARVKREAPEDYDALKAQAAKWAEYEETQKSELEKAQDAAKRAEKEAAKALASANSRLIEAAVLAEGATQNATKPEHLSRLIDLNSVTVGDDGQVTGAGEAVKAFLEANPEYVGKGRPKAEPVDQGARGSTPTISREDLKSMSMEQIMEAQNSGQLDHLLATGE